MDGITYVHIIVCIAAGVLGASFSSLDSRTNLAQTAYHVGLAAAISGFCPTTMKALCPQYPWYLGLIVCFFLGLFIYGIAIAARKFNKSIADLDTDAILNRKLNSNGEKKL